MTATLAPRLQQPRRVERLVAGIPTSDGAGVKLTRVLTQNLQRRLDPFLMLDAFGSDRADDYIAGFPDHPHRGFETITYMIAGRMLHRDSAGHEGLLENGGVQWMTAGHGVIHSEIPQQEEGLMEGFQLWLNLPARDKLCQPWYRDFSNAELPQFTTPEGVAVKDSAWFLQHRDEFDRVVYQFGNSEFHADMFELLRQVPGVVGLHDFHLGGALNWMESHGHTPGAFRDALLRSHGGEALRMEAEQGRFAALLHYPVNRFVLDRASGIIVHSRYTSEAADRWYGAGASRNWRSTKAARRPSRGYHI